MYNGNLDIQCHHTGILRMFEEMSTWSAIDEFEQTQSTKFRVNGAVAGYLTSVQNLRLLAVRNAGHKVPMDVPEVAFGMFRQFVNGDL